MCEQYPPCALDAASLYIHNEPLVAKEERPTGEPQLRVDPRAANWRATAMRRSTAEEHTEGFKVTFSVAQVDDCPGHHPFFTPKVDPGVLLRASSAGSDQAVGHQLHLNGLCDKLPWQGAAAAALELVTACSP